MTMAREELPRATTRSQDFHLTPRESDILECVTRGMTNPEIGRQLHLAPSTVKAHIASIFRKMGVSNRTQAAVLSSRRESSTVG
jgi:DNA-binding NarL/FixJ family response regulator